MERSLKGKVALLTAGVILSSGSGGEAGKMRAEMAGTAQDTAGEHRFEIDYVRIYQKK